MVRMINILIIIKFLPVFVYVYTENHEHCNNFTVYDGNFVEEKKRKNVGSCTYTDTLYMSQINVLFANVPYVIVVVFLFFVAFCKIII